MKIEKVNLSQLQENKSNPRVINDAKFEKLVNSLLALPKMLEIRPVVVDDLFTALGGNMRLRSLSFIASMSDEELTKRIMSINDVLLKSEAEQAALVRYWLAWKDSPTCPIIKASELSDAEKREFIIKDNVGFGEWDYNMLSSEWDAKELDDWGVDEWPDVKWDDDEVKKETKQSEPENGSLNDRFIVPPFSVLDTRKGYWQDRKRIWRKLIGDMGESRNDKLITSLEIKYKDLYQRTRQHREELGISFKEYVEKYVPKEELEREESKVLAAGVSLLDPVMAEIVCRWFGFDNCKTFDCFAGDTIFGYVSSYLGNEFIGIELREEQAQTNNERTKDLPARYICDDGQNVANHIEAESQDLLFSCPPYFDLEVYSDDSRDASNQKTYKDFIGIIENAFKAAFGCLKNDRFAVIVVGDVRNRDTGAYYDFCGDIKRIFKECGANLYNEIILVETGASTALRASRYMDTRKVAKMHQNILVFYKGDTQHIKNNFKKIEYASKDLELFGLDSGDQAGEDS